jgi:aldehyde:ferredoxin oxidoreductase
MHGFMGRILKVDLSTSDVRVIERDRDFYRRYLGGAFLAARLFQEALADREPPLPLAPENPIVFATGPLAGARVCGSTRVNVVSRSPETPGIFTSQGGGEFGPDLKRAGYDALVITGQSAAPVVLNIHNDRVTFEDAAHLWGQDRQSVFDTLSAAQDTRRSIASIGPAGENQAAHANIMFEPDHYAGRGGLGAVMGAKKLKAICIGGDRPVVFKDEAAVQAVNKTGATTFLKGFEKNPHGFLGVLRTYGTFGLLMLNQDIGNLPVRNFNQAQMVDEAFEVAIAHARIGARHVGRRNPCKGCYLGCKKMAAADEGRTPLAEYESMALLGPNLGLSDLAPGLEATALCDRLGLDTISTGALIAYLMDGFENGDLDAEDLGFEIRFGQGDKVLELIRMMARREGRIGNLLADGIAACRLALGAKTDRHLRFAGGMGLPAHLPRAKPGIGFGYLHGPNPGDHMKAEHDWIAASPGDLKAFNITATSEPYALDPVKVEVYRATQIYNAAMDSLSLCLFIFGPGNILAYDDIVKMVNAATGFDYTFDALMRIGEAAIQLQRKLFMACGGRDAELLSYMETPIPEGPSKGHRIDREDFAVAREHYYQLWGWEDGAGS